MNATQLALAALLLAAGSCPAANLSAWFAPATSKVMRQTPPASTPGEWDLAATRNEVESCQLVLVSAEPVRDVAVTASPLVAGRGGTPLEPALFKVDYVPILKERVPFPDPLPPLRGSVELQSGQAQPVWISIRVPKNAAPGVYHGEVKVTAGGWSRRLPLRLKVWHFALPETPSCVTAFGYGPEQIADFHGVKTGSPQALALQRKYYEYLLDHRVSPYTIPADLMSEQAVPYLEDPRMTSFLIPYSDTTSDAELRRLLERLLDGGGFAKGYFYVVDEPSTKAAYDRITAITDRLRRIEPRYRLVLPFWRNPEFGGKLLARDLMLGRVNIWCPHLLFVESEPGFRQFLQRRKQAGESVWWYVCNNPRGAYNNLQIDMSAMASRVLLWQQKRENLQGLLYWDATCWDRRYIQDPWQNMDTLGDGHWGDGSLLYPGNKVGVDGPVGSLRLEAFRDGLEDFDYLTLAERYLGAERTRSYVARIARTLTDYERDPAKLETVRRELGDALERALTGAGGQGR